ncbi:MAG: amino acid adenylation domain-containing protein [Pseudomonadota bacterium]
MKITEETAMLTFGCKDVICDQKSKTNTPYPKDKTIVELFEEQVENTPDSIAIISENERLTYAQLNVKANRLAHYLLENFDIQRDDLIGVLIGQYEKAVIVVLAILKAGGAYVPIDPDYPSDRIIYMLHDTQPKVIISDTHSEDVGVFAQEFKFISFEETDSQRIMPNPVSRNSPTDLAYVIYTSGSTGQPKGIMVEHRSVNRLVKNTNYISITENDRFLQTGSLSFDASTFEIWGSLLNGAALVIPKTLFDLTYLKHYKEDNNVTILWISCGLFSQFVDSDIQFFRDLRIIITGGDRPSISAFNRFVTTFPEICLYNAYGPSENTTFTTYYKVVSQHQADVPIGKPVSNTYVHILREDLTCVEIGETGEIFCGGDGLARGYLHRKELTTEKFIAHPFMDGERLYRTGDMARWLPDGNIDFVARLDDQVKVRGFRIELGEVEHALCQHELVDTVLAVVKETMPGNKELVAYYIAKQSVEPSELRDYLAGSLPDYMLPTHFIEVPSFPLTPNGKIDKKNLPDPITVFQSIHSTFIGPQNDIESRLVAIWSNVLGISPIGTQENFFFLGGHSLKAVKIISRIRTQFSVAITIKELFTHPTIQTLAKKIHDQGHEVFSPIPVTSPKATYPLSHAQRRLWLIEQMDKGGMAYILPFAYRVKGQLDIPALEQAFNYVVQRHESLRTVFFVDESHEPVQKILQNADIRIEHIIEKDRLRTEMIVEEKLWHPFDLQTGPLIRMHLISRDADEHILLLVMHHIVSDGWSMNVLSKELKIAYASLQKGVPIPLQTLPLQYTDYVCWQKQQHASDQFDLQRRYWRVKFGGDLPRISLVVDSPRPKLQTFHGSQYNVPIDREISDKMTCFAQQNQSSLFMLLTAILKILIYRYTGDEDIVIGSISAGRNHPDLENQVGFYVNTLALRDTLSGEDCIHDVLGKVRKTIEEALDNQDYPFDQLVLDLVHDRDMARFPLFDVLVVLQNNDAFDLALEGVQVHSYPFENRVSKFDLTFEFIEQQGGLELQVNYNTDLFTGTRIERMTSHLMTLMESVLLQENCPISLLPLNSEEENQRILNDFNNTKIPYQKEKTILHLFEEQVDKTPNSIAVIFEDMSLTYCQLNERANQLTHFLKIDHHVAHEDLIGVVLNRSEKVIIAFLAILKAGCAYMPLDPHAPTDRLNFMVADAQPKVIIFEKDAAPQFCESTTIPLVNIDLQYSDLRYNPDNLCTSKSLAYVIFTSGSTGKPKGVLIEHQGLLNNILGCHIYRDYPETIKASATSAFTFDASIQQIAAVLTAGHCLCILSELVILDMIALINTLEKHQIKIFNSTPSLVQELLLQFARNNTDISLEKIITGGELLPLSVPGVLQSKQIFRHLKIFNVYGATETCIDNTQFILDSSTQLQTASVPIGKPKANVQIFILSDAQQLQPIGIPGEICMSGDILARGYLHRPDVTQDKFVPNPYLPGQTMYRTGDLGCWLPDGNIEFLGRMDDQVKIRGYRIELGEIEQVLLSNPRIESAVVLAKEIAAGNKEVVAYYTSSDALNSKDIRKQLSKSLPVYMVPSFYKRITTFPLTSHGKINKKALLAMDLESLDERFEHHVPPKTDLEKQVHFYFSTILGHENFGITDDFFAIGGTSMSAVQIVSKIREALWPNISVANILRHRTIESLIHHFQKKEAVNQAKSKDASRRFSPDHRDDKGFIHLDDFIDQGDDYEKEVPAGVRCFLQIFGSIFISIITGMSVVPSILLLFMIREKYGLLSAVFSAPLAGPGIILSGLLLTAGIKWLVIGKYRSGVHKVWSWYFLRWWFVGRLISYTHLIMVHWIRETMFINWWISLLGGTVHKGAVISTIHITEPDLIEIGENTTIDEDAHICGHTFHKGHLILGPVKIGANSYIGAMSVVLPFSQIEENVFLDRQSLIKTGQRCPRATYWQGSPAKMAENPYASGHHPFTVAAHSHPLLLFFLQLLGVVILSGGIVVALIPLFFLSPLLSRAMPNFLSTAITLCIGPVLFLSVFAAVCIVSKWLLIGRTRKGIKRSGLWLAWRQWLVNRFLTSVLFRALAEYTIGGTILCNWLYRALGVTIGKRTLIAAPIVHHDSDLITIGDDVWIGSRLQMFPTARATNHSHQVHNQCSMQLSSAEMHVAPISIEHHSIIAERCIMMPGSQMQPWSSLGSLSVVSQNQCLPENSIWLGSPAQIIHAHKDGERDAVRHQNVARLQQASSSQIIKDKPASLTHYAFGRIVQVLLVIFFLFLQAVAMIPCLFIFQYIHFFSSGLIWRIAIIPFLFLLFGLFSFSLSIIIKRILMPSFSGAHRYWSLPFITWEFMNRLMIFGVAILFKHVRGSALASVIVRCFGAKIGSNVFYDTMPPCEMDLISIGDNVILQEDSFIIAHVVDNGYLQHGPVTIEAGCSINVFTIILPGAIMRASSTLEPLSLLLKGEIITENTVWHGNPAQLASE